MSKDYCIALHDDKQCFLTNRKYQLKLMGKFEELLQKLDAFCFTYQHVDCQYTLFKYRFSDKIVKSGQVIENLQRAVYFNQRTKGVDWMPSTAKTILLRWKYRKHLLSSFRKTKSTQTSASVCAWRFEQGKKTKYELVLIKIVDCFPDVHDKYASDLVTFKIESS